MQKTTDYNLNKPESADYVQIARLNENMDTIDTKLKELETNSDYSVVISMPSVEALISGGADVKNISEASVYIVRCGNVITVYAIDVSITSTEENGVISLNLSENDIKNLLMVEDFNTNSVWMVKEIYPQLSMTQTVKPYNVDGWYGIAGTFVVVENEGTYTAQGNLSIVIAGGGEQDSSSASLSATGIVLNGVTNT